jgi:hypothetical protein
LGQASFTWTLSAPSWLLSARSSNDAAPSANRIGISEPNGQSGNVTSLSAIPSFFIVSIAARSTSVAGLSFIHCAK